MSSRPESPGPTLAGTEGELVSIRIAVEPRALERTLETLARLSFPINPQIFHEDAAAVEFPAWSGRLSEVREALRAAGLPAAALSVRSMWSAVRRLPDQAEAVRTA